jgi:hypothetical protein
MSLPTISQEKPTVAPPLNGGNQQRESTPTPEAATPVVVSHGGMVSWQGVPDDILRELMAWTARMTGSVDTVHAMACVSKQFNASFREFRADDRYIQSYWSSEKHTDTSKWVRRALQTPAIRPIQNSPKDADDLNKFISQSVSLYEKLEFKFCLQVHERNSSAYTDEAVAAFGKYTGTTLAVVSPAEPWSIKKIVEIEKALPAKVSLNVIISGSASQITDLQFAQFITEVCKGKRPIAFDFQSFEFMNLPLATEALFNALCGQGFVMSVSVSLMNSGSAATLLTDMAMRINHLRHVQLIHIADVAGCVSDQAIQALVRAVAERRNVNGARVNIVIDAIGLMLLESGDKSLLSSEMKAQLEKAGLYFGPLSVNCDLLQRVMDTTGQQKFGFSIENDASKEIDENADSDSVIESSSDDEHASVAIPSETRVQESVQRQSPRINEPATEPSVKKRDRCVIS